MFGNNYKKLMKVAVPTASASIVADKINQKRQLSTQLSSSTNPKAENASSSKGLLFTSVANYFADWGDWLDPCAGTLGKIEANKKYISENTKEGCLDLHGKYLGHEYYKKIMAILQIMPDDMDAVNVSGNNLGLKRSVILEQIFGAFKPSILKINLSGNNFGSNQDLLPTALRSLKAPITWLDLTYNDFDKLPGKYFAAITASIPKTVKYLAMYENNFATMPIKDLVCGLEALTPNIEYLNLRYSKLGKRKCAELCAVFACIKAKSVGLRENNLGNLSADDFATVMANLSDSIEVLDLTFNDFKYTAAEWLKIIAAMKPTLKKVILHGNRIGLTLSSNEILEVLQAFSEKLQDIDISYNYIDGSLDFYLQMFKIANKFTNITLDYSSIFRDYVPSPANDAKVLELIDNLPKGQKTLNWFSVSELNLSRFNYDLLLQIIANAPAHVDMLNMHNSGYLFKMNNDGGYFNEDGTYHNPTASYSPRFSIEQWRRILRAAPPTITKVSFYACEFGEIYTGNELAEILGSLNDSVEEVSLGYNSLKVNNMLIQGLMALKPSMKSVDLRLNYFGHTLIDDFIKLLNAVPNTVEFVYLPDDVEKYNSWSNEDLQLLNEKFPGLCCYYGDGNLKIMPIWQRPKVSKIALKIHC